MSKASRRSSRATRGAAGRPGSAGPTGSSASIPGRPSSAGGANPPGSGLSSDQAGSPTVDASALASRAPVARPATTRGAGSRPAGSRPASSSRPRRTLYQPSFYGRHRMALFGGGLAIIVALVGGFFFFSLTASAYSCGTIPAPLARRSICAAFSHEAIIVAGGTDSRS